MYRRYSLITMPFDVVRKCGIPTHVYTVFIYNVKMHITGVSVIHLKMFLGRFN
jgi:hypothetical protein